MSGSAVSGFLLGLSLILAIGAQNLFVLRQGIKGQHVFVICLICALSDAILIALGVAGMGQVVEQWPELITYMTWFAALWLFAYGLLRLKSAIEGSEIPSESEVNDASTLRLTIVTCLAFTWLNPHVYLDTMVLMGTASLGHAPDLRPYFALGGVTASFVFFFSLGYGASLLRPLFASRRAWRILDMVMALVMFALAWKIISG